MRARRRGVTVRVLPSPTHGLMPEKPFSRRDWLWWIVALTIMYLVFRFADGAMMPS